MATINGVTLKAIKTGIGHDLAGFQANIYLNNKKIGYALDDGWGGQMDIRVEKKDREVFMKTATDFHNASNDGLFTAEEALIFELLQLSDREKDFKKALKKGYSFIVHFDYSPRDKDGKVNLDKPIPYPTEEVYFLVNDAQLTKLLQEKQPGKHNIYRSLEDFKQSIGSN